MRFRGGLGCLFGESDGRSGERGRRVWARAREKALTAKEVESPLARRPYDLRHACVSTWLNAGVPAPQVAEWAGHSVDVLLRIYAACVVGQDADRQAPDLRSTQGVTLMPGDVGTYWERSTAAGRCQP